MSFLRYTLLRVLVFLTVAALLWVVGLRGLWLVMVAVLASGIVSIFALTKSRDAASASLANRMAEVKRRREQKSAAEDAWNDRVRADSADPGPTGNRAATDADE